jgi:hypothetical protein
MKAWVEGGGILFLHGERWVTDVFPAFNRNWIFSGDSYRRVTHKRGENFPKVGPTYCVKATMLSNVVPEERVFYAGEGKQSMSMVPGFGSDVESDKCPLAFAKIQKGAIGFFGDVNAETVTILTVLQLVKRS